MQRWVALLVILLLPHSAAAQASLRDHHSGFTPGDDVAPPNVIMAGHWYSCQDTEDGEPGRIVKTYGERVYDHPKLFGIPPFELHLGPYHDFSIFKGIQEEHRDHNGPGNLLDPHEIGTDSNRAAHIWDVPSLGVRLEVHLSGGSFEDCESWVITLSRLEKPVSNQKPQTR